MQQPAPVPDNAPLARWQNAWRFALCVAISGIAWWHPAVMQWQHSKPLFWVDLALGLASFPLVTYRRRWPFGVAMTGAVLGLLSVSASGPATLAGVSLATRRELPKIVAVGVVGVVCSLGLYEIEPWATGDPRWIDIGFASVYTIAFSAAGMYLGSRRELLRSLRDRAEQAERQQGLRMEQARALERERIAREMHDVLAHRISLVTMHAGALTYRTDLTPEQVRETAEVISAKAHEALADLRAILGTLRETEPMRPQPTLAELPALIDEASDGGMRVIFDSTLVDAPAVPERIGRTAYRLVQEGLTNARKHAPGSAVAVALSGAAGEGVTIAVHNARTLPSQQPSSSGTNGSPPGSGLGLVGMRERLELAGGRLAVREDRHSFALEGWLPWPA